MIKTPLVILALILVASVNVKGVEAQSQPEFDEEYVEYIMGYVDNIKSLLGEAKVEYEQGNKDAAMILATKAYIDNYEFLESELAEYNEELIEEVEWMMREELRGMIQNDAPVSEVGDKIDTILVKMDSIAAIVPEFGSVLIIFAIGIVVTIIVFSKNNIVFSNSKMT